MNRNILAIIFISCAAIAIDNPHFWRATNFLPQFYEPRIAKNWLFSFDIFAGYGQTHSSRNGKGETVPLLALYGPENISTLAIGLPGLSMNNPVDITLQNLALLGCPCDFGQLIFCGKFRLAEANFCFTQNLACGFFTQLHFPFRDMKIQNISSRDNTNQCSDSNPDTCNIFWQTFLNLRPQFLSRFGLFESKAPSTSKCCPSPSCNGMHKTGIGDTTFMLGWAFNYEETEALDYVDFTVRTGILIPTGQKRNPDVVFDIANGYDGHIGIPVSLSFAIGYFEWLTIGAHAGGMMFVRRETNFRVHTDPSQNGFIKLLPAQGTIQEGPIWEILTYLKADHFCGGLSFLAGYNFATQHRNQLSLCDTSFVCSSVACADSTLLGWKMHTINLYLEYDFSQEERILGPRLGIFYNLQVGGERIFKTNMAGGFFGFDLSVCF